MGQPAVNLAPMSIQDCKFKSSTTWSLLTDINLINVISWRYSHAFFCFLQKESLLAGFTNAISRYCGALVNLLCVYKFYKFIL